MFAVRAACVLALLGLCVAVNPSLEAECEDWIVSNQKELAFTNNMADQSNLGSCQQYCMVAGAGVRSSTTSCRSLCEQSGSITKFTQALNMKQGTATPSEMCAGMLAKQAEPAAAVSFLEEPAETHSQRRIGVRGDMTVQGSLVTSILTSPVGDVKVSGELNVMNQIESTSARAAFLKADSGVSIKQGIVSKKDQLLIKGKIDADSVTAETMHASFLEIGGVRQWSLHSLEDFEEAGVDGWSHGEVTECAGQKLLGGHCVDKGAEVTKTFTNLPPHSQIRINAKYMFIDSWDGESGFLKVNNNVVWAETYNHRDGENKAQGMNMCGNATPERKWGSRVDVVVPHTEDSITLTFGATTDEHPCDESFGIDSVMLFTR